MAKNFFIVIGLAFVLLGLALNPWAMGKFFSFSEKLEKSTITAIVIIEFIFIGIGLIFVSFNRLLLKKKKEIFLLAATCLIVISMFSFILLKFYSFGWENAFGSDAIRHHKVIPNTNFRLLYPDYKNLDDLYHKKASKVSKAHTNSFGFVDDEVDISDKSKFRILMLGDSFTEGAIFEKDFSDILEEKIRQFKKSDKYEVINAGLGSYSPIIEYNVLKYIVINFSPRIVILNLDMTDVANDFEYSKSAVFIDEKTYTFSQKKPVISNEKIYDGIKLLFSIFKSFGDGLNNFIGKYGKENSEEKIKQTVNMKRKNSGNISVDTLYAYSYKNETEFKSHLNVTLHYIYLMNKLAKESNMTFIVHSYPHSPQISNEYWCFRDSVGLERNKIYSNLIFDELAEFSRANNIILWLSKDVLKSSKIEPYFKCDMHLNEHGQKIIAEFLFDSLSKNKLI